MDSKPIARNGILFAALGVLPTVAVVFLTIMLDDHLLNWEHGSHTFLKCVFPLPLILTMFSLWIAIIGALIQFPVYGYLIGSTEKPAQTAAAILAIHVGAVALIYLVAH